MSKLAITYNTVLFELTGLRVVWLTLKPKWAGYFLHKSSMSVVLPTALDWVHVCRFNCMKVRTTKMDRVAHHLHPLPNHILTLAPQTQLAVVWWHHHHWATSWLYFGGNGHSNTMCLQIGREWKDRNSWRGHRPRRDSAFSPHCNNFSSWLIMIVSLLLWYMEAKQLMESNMRSSDFVCSAGLSSHSSLVKWIQSSASCMNKDI